MKNDENKTKIDNKDCIEDALEILDKEYFHICKKIDGNGKTLSWVVYYKNMNDEDFLSKYNKPILDSRYSTLDDVIKTIQKFDKSKTKANKNIIWEKFVLNNIIFNYTSKITDEFAKIETIVGILLMIFIIIIGLLGNGKFVLCYPLILIPFVIMTICLDYLHKKMFDGTNIILAESEKVLLKNELKHRRDNVYEFTKKNRKNDIKKIQPNRFKKQDI